MTEFTYAGAELDVFAHAVNWKSYLRSQLRAYLKGDVLEVGAGIGATTKLLRDAAQRRWVCLEPDRGLAAQIEATGCEIVIGSLDTLPAGELFDAILYIDVLEHIEDDAAEMSRAAGHLKPHGVIAVLSPAHPWLFTPFDAAIGHFRRYTKASLRAVAPHGLKEEKMVYLDSAGMTASLANRLVLHSATPDVRQIRIWDRMLVPVSRILDPLLGYSIGKSVLGIWRKQL